MISLRNLRRLMIENGLMGKGFKQAASLEIIPFYEDGFLPDNSLNKSQPGTPVNEGSGCGTGCVTGCSHACGISCLEGCTTGCLAGNAN